MKFWLTLAVSVLLICAPKGSDSSGKKTSQSKHAISIRRVKELLLGHVHFFAVANTSECSRCAEFMEKIPEFNKELATVNKTLRMYTVDDLAFNAMYLEKRNPRLPSVALLVAGGDSVPYYYYPFPDLVRSFAEQKFTKMLRWTAGVTRMDRIRNDAIRQKFEDARSSLAMDVLKTTVQKIEPHSTIEEFQKSAKVTVVFVVDDEDKEVDFITTLARRNLKVKFGYVMKGSSIAEGLTDYVYVNIINSEQKSMGHAPVDEIARFVKVRLVARIH
ncbi:unnamed protein product [Heligmosomoides polygyrus]|uniref:Thioredoxin domain-containing protein n=1 Tax=Heligmosomoides polygyrus TaxID=6339 RepID=A0A183FFC3_HELPZ|nr:unnamed protein product [Heligmosomoides polygyrus]